MICSSPSSLWNRLWNGSNSYSMALLINLHLLSFSVAIFSHDPQRIYTSMICQVSEYLSDDGNERSLFADAFKSFAKLVAKYPDICERAHFVFVPGPQDRHTPKIYPRFVSSMRLISWIRWKFPRAPLPPLIQDILKKRIRHLHLATNPVRLQYCTQEIVIFREDLLQKLCRYCIKLPSDNLPMHVTVLLSR